MIISFSFSCILICFIEWEENRSELLVNSHNLKPTYIYSQLCHIFELHPLCVAAAECRKYNSRTDRYYGKALNRIGSKDQLSALNIQVVSLFMLNVKWNYVFCWPSGALCEF